MTTNLHRDEVVISLPASFVDALLKMHGAFDSRVLEELQSSVRVETCIMSAIEPKSLETVSEPLPKKYSAEFLGISITAWTLPELYAQIVDMTALVAPDALDKLAGFRARTRRFVARTPELIHPGNKYLPVLQTASGWWISKNIGQVDLKRVNSL